MCKTITRTLLIVSLGALVSTAAAQRPSPPQAAADSIDRRSLRVAIDGVDRAFGDTLGPLAPGLHRIAARICTIRGACVDLSTTMTVTAPPEARTATGLLSKILDVLLDVVRRLLNH